MAWNNASLQKCKAIADVFAKLNSEGANLRTPSRVGELLDEGLRVYKDKALWERLPNRIYGNTKTKLRGDLKRFLDESR